MNRQENTMTDTAYNIKSLTQYDPRVNGSAYIGSINLTYPEAVRIFGEPTLETDKYKTDVEWILEISVDGTPGRFLVTVYNYKNGVNYLGAEGEAVEKMTSFHVGGRDPDHLSILNAIVDDLLEHHARA